MLMHRSDYAVIPFAAETDFLESAEFLPPGCVLAQISPDTLGNYNLLTAMAEKRHELPLIALCSPCDVPTAVHIIKSGAIDVFDLNQSDDELLLAVQKAFAVLPERIRRADLHKMARERIEVLTPRELTVLKRIARGMLSKQIAHEMDLSVRTVEMHRSHILRRLNVRSMGDCVQLFHLAFQESAFDDLIAQATAHAQ
jgi:two-component system response regulator FixJ